MPATRPAAKRYTRHTTNTCLANVGAAVLALIQPAFSNQQIVKTHFQLFVAVYPRLVYQSAPDLKLKPLHREKILSLSDTNQPLAPHMPPLYSVRQYRPCPRRILGHDQRRRPRWQRHHFQSQCRWIGPSYPKKIFI